MAPLTLGIIATSRKEGERRVPIHPDHLSSIPAELRGQLVFERGYGAAFGVGDERLAAIGAGLAGREEILARTDVVVLPKPLAQDLEQMSKGGTLWGWAHCVQNAGLTQVAINRRLTLIAWESMNEWGPGGQWRRHVFEANNEIAGYAGVIHALGLIGVTGHHGPPRTAVVIHFGSVGRGAVRGLRAHGFGRVTVLTSVPPGDLAHPAEGVEYRQVAPGPDGRLTVLDADGAQRPLIDELAAADVIANAVLQDPGRPLMFVRAGEVGRLRPGCLIIDLSCDAGMGFAFARATTFAEPIRRVGPARYYAVDHTPSYLWNSASWEISRALLPYLPVVAAGPDAWQANQTLRRAVEVRDGRVLNPTILSFQKRAPEYPHAVSPGGREGGRP